MPQRDQISLILETEIEKKVDGYKLLKAVRYSYEIAGLALLSIELSQGTEKAEEVLVLLC